MIFITGGIHPRHWVSQYPFRDKWKLPNAFKDGMPSTKGDIIVGSDVWIGTGALVLSGVTIGDGAVIAAKAVVVDDVPPYSVVAGVPAKVTKYRFDPKTIDKLLLIRWWEWDDSKIRDAIPLLSSHKIDEFITKYKTG